MENETELDVSTGGGSRRADGIARRRWLNSAYWLLFDLISRGAGFVRSILVARFLPPEAASLGFLSISLGAAAQASLNSGTIQILVSANRVDDELLKASWWLEVCKGVLVAVLFAAAGLVVSGLDLKDWSPSILWLAALAPLATGFINPGYRLWERNGRHDLVVLVAAVGTLASVAVLAFLLVQGGDWWAVPVALATGQLALAGISHAFGEELPAQPVRWRAVAALFRRGLPILVMALASYFSSLGVDLLLALFGAVAWVAPYRLSAALVHTVLSAVPAVVARASLSEDAARRRAAGGHVGINLVTVTAVSAVTVLLVPLAHAGLPPVAAWVYGPEWSSTAILIPALTVAVGLRALSWPHTTMFIASLNYGVEARIHLLEALLAALAVGALATTSITLGIWTAALVSAGGLAVRCKVLMKLLPEGAKAAAIVSGTSAAAIAFVSIAANLLAHWEMTVLVASAIPAAAMVVLVGARVRRSVST